MHGSHGIFTKVDGPLSDTMVLDTTTEWLKGMGPGEVLDKAALEYIFWRPFLPDYNETGEHFTAILGRLIKERRIISYKWNQMPATFRFRYASNRGFTTEDHLRFLAQSANEAQAVEINALLEAHGYETGGTLPPAPVADEAAILSAFLAIARNELQSKPSAKHKALVEALADRGMVAPPDLTKERYLALVKSVLE